MKQELLAKIPKMDVLLQDARAAAAAEKWSRVSVADALRSVTDEFRREILSGERDRAPEKDEIFRAALRKLEAGNGSALRPVVNGTGVVLHTNFGRAPLSRRAREAVRAAASEYTDLEYSLRDGKRCSRQAHISKMMRVLCGTEDAMAVNNNAAAVLLALTALAKGKEVLVSRGELTEIGGSFRIPEICGESGALLREVGSTNCTRISDYRRAVGENTGAILKVHAGNYRIRGYTEETGIRELAALSREAGIPLIYDMGSGVFTGLEAYGIDEPRIPDALKDGADLVTFSGDKLLGGAQAGLIAGKAEFVGKLKHHPLSRALRVDKMTLAAVEATLEEYRDPAGAVREIPALAMICEEEDALRIRAERLCRKLREAEEERAADAGRSVEAAAESGGNVAAASESERSGKATTESGGDAAAASESERSGKATADSSGNGAAGVRFLFSAEPCRDKTGGGTAPLTDLPGYAVTVRLAGPSGNLRSTEDLEAALRTAKYPLVAFLRQDRLWISVRTLLEGDEERIAEDFRTVL